MPESLRGSPSPFPLPRLQPHLLNPFPHNLRLLQALLVALHAHLGSGQRAQCHAALSTLQHVASERPRTLLRQAAYARGLVRLALDLPGPLQQRLAEVLGSLLACEAPE